MSKREPLPRTLNIADTGRIAVPEPATFTDRKQRGVYTRFVRQLVTLCRKADEELEYWTELAGLALQVLEEEGIELDEFEDDDDELQAA